MFSISKKQIHKDVDQFIWFEWQNKKYIYEYSIRKYIENIMTLRKQKILELLYFFKL